MVLGKRRDIYMVLALILLANVFKSSPVYNLFYLLAMVVLSKRLWRDFPRFFVISFLVGFLAEIVGTHTGIPFGRYYYKNLKPQLFGVAVFVPFAWVIFGFISYLTARYYFRHVTIRVAFASILMVVLDLSIDPIMISWKAWVWRTTTTLNWFGIPWTNYLGWFIVSSTFFYLYERFSKGEIEAELLKLGSFVYLMEMFTFIVYAPTEARTPTMIAFLISIMVLFYLWRWVHEGRSDSHACN